MNRRLLAGAFLAPVLVLLVLLGLKHGRVAWRIHHRQPSKESASKSFTPEGVFQRTACEFWKTDEDEFFYAIAVGHVDYEPIMPDISYEYSWSIKGRGKLIVNRSPVTYANANRILALNPFGEMQEIDLSEAETLVVVSENCKEIWESVVLPRLYQFRGQSDNGRRIGHWTCLDLDGKTAYEGDYVNGQRDGKWTYFYPSGGVRAIIHYRNGERHGKWTYFAKDGAQESVLTWDRDFPVERAALQVGMAYYEIRYPNGNSEGGSGKFLR